MYFVSIYFTSKLIWILWCNGFLFSQRQRQLFTARSRGMFYVVWEHRKSARKVRFHIFTGQNCGSHYSRIVLDGFWVCCLPSSSNFESPMKNGRFSATGIGQSRLVLSMEFPITPCDDTHLILLSGICNLSITIVWICFKWIDIKREFATYDVI